MASDLAKGKWSFHSSDKFDEYMKCIGVSMATRLIAGKLKPDQEISIEDGVWTIKTSSTFKNTESSFKLDEPFEEQTPDGRKVKVQCSVEGNKLIRKEQGDVESIITREFTPDQFTMTMECKGVVCTRVYKKSN